MMEQQTEPTPDEINSATPVDPEAIDLEAIKAQATESRQVLIEISDASAALSKLIRQHAEIKLAKAESAKSFSDRLTTCESQIQRANEALELAQTEEFFDWTLDVVIRRHRVNHEEISKRTIRFDERQQPLRPAASPTQEVPVPSVGQVYSRDATGEYTVTEVSEDGDVTGVDDDGDTTVVTANAWETSGFQPKLLLEANPEEANPEEDVGEVEQMEAEVVAPKRRGRPKGSKNKGK